MHIYVLLIMLKKKNRCEMGTFLDEGGANVSWCSVAAHALHPVYF